MHRLGTKDHHERYEEEADRLVRPNTKVKPPRHDLRREKIQPDKDPDTKDPSDAKDRSMNYKNVGGSATVVARFRAPETVVRRFLAKKDRIPAKSRETGQTVTISPNTLKERPDKYEAIDPKEPKEEKSPAKQEDFYYPDNPADFVPSTPKAPKAPEVEEPQKREEDFYYPDFPSEPSTPKPKSKGKGKKKPEAPVEDKANEPEPKEVPKEQAPAPSVEDKLEAPAETKAPPEVPEKPQTPAPEMPETQPEPVEDTTEEDSEEDGGETPQGEAPPETPKPEPSVTEKAGIAPPKRREVSVQERREALNAVLGSFPPETAAKVIAANLHPDDLKVLIRKYNAAKISANVGDPSKFAEKVAEFYQPDPTKVAPPKEWGGKSLKAMTPEEQSEATRQYQVQQVALSLAAKDALTKTLSNPGKLLGKAQIPKEMASKLASLMLSKVPPEQSSRVADQIFDQTLKEGKLDKLGDGAIKKLLSQVSGNPVAKKAATAWLQANDYQAAKQKFLTSGDISEWDSPGSILNGLRKANQYFTDRSKVYGSEHEEHPASSMFRRRLLSRLQSLSPKRASEVQRLLPKLEMTEYHDKKRAWGAKFKDWEKRREAYESALDSHKQDPKNVEHPGEFTEEEPVKPSKPLTSIDTEDGESMWEEALNKKVSSDSTYPEDTMMGSKTSVYHGIAPVAVTYPGWEQPHQREFGEAEAKKVLAEAKDWLSSPILTVAMDGSVPDAKFRAALDYALLSTNHRVDPVQYNELLAKLSGLPAPTVVKDPQGNLGEVKQAADSGSRRHPLPKEAVNPKYHREGFIENLDEYKAEAVLTPETQEKAKKLLGAWKDMKPSSILTSLGLVKKTAAAPFKPTAGMKASKELRKFATRVSDMTLAFDMLSFADHLAEEEEKTQQYSDQRLASESKLVALRSNLIRKAAELDPTIQAAIKPILQAIKDLG